MKTKLLLSLIVVVCVLCAFVGSIYGYGNEIHTEDIGFCTLTGQSWGGLDSNNWLKVHDWSLTNTTVAGLYNDAVVFVDGTKSSFYSSYTSCTGYNTSYITAACTTFGSDNTQKINWR
jgi:hypothetical protein